MNVVRPSDEKVTPERYCSSCHPYGWPNGPMPHEPWCTAAPVIRPSNERVRTALRQLVHRASEELGGFHPVVTLAEEILEMVPAHETLEHDVWCPMGSPSLTCTCAERGSQKASESLKDHTK